MQPTACLSPSKGRWPLGDDRIVPDMASAMPIKCQPRLHSGATSQLLQDALGTRAVAVINITYGAVSRIRALPEY